MRRVLALLTVAGVIAAGLASVAGPEALATTPGRNGRIVFSADLGLGGEIYTIRPNGTGLRQLTELEGNAFHPDWSPDGTRIVFWLEDQAIYIMNADGSDLHRVTEPGGQPSFTPDGRHIVYECASENCDGESGIFLMRDDGSDAPGLRLTNNPFPDEGDSDPQVSPDGVTVTFVRHKVDGKLQALFAVDFDGEHLRKIAPYTLEVGIKHDWAPDGSRIAITPYADFPDATFPSVATIEPDGSGLHFLTSPVRGDVAFFAGSYSPNGQWIVYRAQDVDQERFRLMKMRPDGGDRTLIATLPFSPRFIDWGSRPPD
jgi:Tol biopolymer transport system component